MALITKNDFQMPPNSGRYSVQRHAAGACPFLGPSLGFDYD